jgi:hypothetical protein
MISNSRRQKGAAHSLRAPHPIGTATVEEENADNG